MTDIITAGPALEDMIWADSSVQVVDSKFPVRMNTEALGLLDEVRAFVVRMPDPTDHLDFALVVLNSGTGGGPLVEFTDYVTQIDVMNPSVVQLRLETLGSVSYEVSGGCGCGSRLKSYNPWSTRMSGAPRPPLPWSYED